MKGLTPFVLSHHPPRKRKPLTGFSEIHVKRFLIRRWFLIALLALFLVGLTFSKPLAPVAASPWLRQSLLATVLFVMALPLEARTILRSFRRPAAPLLATGVNLGLLPLVAWGLVGLLSKGWLTPDLTGGILVAAVTPCTLASASVWTRKANGNDSVAMLVTVGTNLVCFVVSPLWLLWMTQQADIDLNVGEMIRKLGLLVVLPMALAQAIRVKPAIARIATSQKTPLGVIAQCGILTMVTIGAVGTGQRLADQTETPALGQLILMIAVVLTIHTGMFVVGTGLGRSLGLSRPDWIAVGFSGSQKTLMVGLHLSIVCGFSILPMITYHIGQLFVDTLIADYLTRGVRRQP